MLQVHSLYSFFLFLLIGSFILLQTASLKCQLSNCLTCPSNPLICQTCTGDQNCCQQSCANCQNQTKCIECITGFQLSKQGICQLSNSCSQSSCISCNLNKCNLCLNTFILNNNTYECMLCPKYCDKCSSSKICLRCIPEFYITPEGGCAQTGMSNCYRPIGGLECAQCYPGYYLSNLGCPQCIYGCNFCTNQTNCYVCANGYFLTTNKNGSIQCNQCNSVCSNNCYGNSKNCTLCPLSSIEIQGNCTQCRLILPFCVTCQFNSTSNLPFCTNCKAGMFVSEQGCTRCLKGCDSCLNQTTCQFCKQMFYMNNQGVCQPCLIQNCINCTNNSICLTCRYYFYLNQNQTQCLPCPPGCVSCSSYSNCISAIMGHAITNGIALVCDSICLFCQYSSSNCIACYDGFFLSPITPQFTTCQICAEYCVYCSFQGCDFCRGGTYLENKNCYICPVDNCFDCNQTYSTNSCALCITGFYLTQQGLCNSCPQGCLTCLNITICLQCQNGYYKQNGACSPCSIGCSLCNSTTCYVCAQGYYGQGQQQSCFNCPIGCRSCSSSNICYQCQPGFYLAIPQAPAPSLPLCYPCIQPCLICSSNTTCATCSLGYEINQQGGCDRCPHNFMVCARGFGYYCFPGFFMALMIVDNQYTLTCLTCPQNCSICRQQNSSAMFCQKCQNGFMLSNQGQCFLCNSLVQNCLQCDSNGNCNTCISGFQLTKNECIVKESETQSSWSLIGANIALGCLAMILLIAILIQSHHKSIRPSSIGFQLIDTK